MIKVTFPVPIQRRFIDPIKINDNSCKIDHHLLFIECVNLPKEIPLTPNPREQNTNKKVYKEVRDSLTSDSENNFHLKNKGITIIAHSVKYYNLSDQKIAEVEFDKEDGIVDGGHTFKIICENREKIVLDQYVKLEIITGIESEYIDQISEGLNTTVQVQQQSLLNSQKKFDWIKEGIAQTTFRDKISYVENEKCEFDITDIVSILTLFNIDLLENEANPKLAYSQKGICLKRYNESFDKPDNSFLKLKPILIDILQLHDYINFEIGKLYNKLPRKTKYAKHNFVKIAESKNGKKGFFNLIFINKKSETVLFKGALYPILGAFRYLVEQKEGEEFYSWKMNSFNDVLDLFRQVGAEMIEITKSTSENNKRNPTLIGKDDNYWRILFQTVIIKHMEMMKK